MLFAADPASIMDVYLMESFQQHTAKLGQSSNVLPSRSCNIRESFSDTQVKMKKFPPLFTFGLVKILNFVSDFNELWYIMVHAVFAAVSAMHCHNAGT